MRRLIFLCHILAAGFQGCSGQADLRNGIGNFDVSRSDSSLVFSFFSAGRSSIYSYDLIRGNISSLLEPDVKHSFVNPRYSSNGERILFLQYPVDSIFETTLCFSDLRGHNIIKLIRDRTVSEAVFSDDGESIIFVKASSIASSGSRISIVGATDFDLFSVDIKTRIVTRLTNFHAFSMSGLSVLPSGSFLIHFKNEKLSGIFVVKPGSAAEISRMSPMNNPRGDLNLYSLPFYNANFNVVLFKAPYQLYAMDAEKKIAWLVSEPLGEATTNIQSFKMFNSRERVVFTRVAEETSLFFVDLDGQNRTHVRLPMYK